MKTLYRLEQPGDCEGRTSNWVGIFFNREDAAIVGKTGYKNQGMGPSEGTITPMTVYESIAEFADAEPKYNGAGLAPYQIADRLRKSGLAKLTPEERTALGLK